MIWCVAVVAAITSCGRTDTGRPGEDPGTRTAQLSPESTEEKRLRPARCPRAVDADFTCALQQRINRAKSYARTLAGTVGVVLRDRATRAVWANDDAKTEFAAASTVKLAMAVDLLLRDRSHVINLTAGDRARIDDMLHVSSDVAADVLWDKYEDGDFARRSAGYGMPGLGFAAAGDIYWGSMYCSPRDLDGLISYVLGESPRPIREYLISAMRRVAVNQQFGVWGAGPRNHPGNKAGWVYDGGYWALSSVGFAGPRQRYTLAMMSVFQGSEGYETGVNALTQIAGLLYQGRKVQAPQSEPTP